MSISSSFTNNSLIQPQEKYQIAQEASKKFDLFGPSRMLAELGPDQHFIENVISALHRKISEKTVTKDTQENCIWYLKQLHDNSKPPVNLNEKKQEEQLIQNAVKNAKSTLLKTSTSLNSLLSVLDLLPQIATYLGKESIKLKLLSKAFANRTSYTGKNKQWPTILALLNKRFTKELKNLSQNFEEEDRMFKEKCPSFDDVQLSENGKRLAEFITEINLDTKAIFYGFFEFLTPLYFPNINKIRIRYYLWDRKFLLPPLKLPLKECSIDGEWIISKDFLDNLPQEIEILEFSNCHFSDELLPNPKRFPKLRKLSLTYCSGITKAVLDNLPPGIDELNLSRTRLCDKDFNRLPKTLKVFKLTKSSSHTSFNKAALQHFSMLQELAVDMLVLESDTFSEPSSKIVKLTFVSEFDDNLMMLIRPNLQNLTHLKELTFSASCVAICIFLASVSKQIEKIDITFSNECILGNACNLEDILSQLGDFKNLKELRLSSRDYPSRYDIDGRAFTQLPISLKQLTIRNCSYSSTSKSIGLEHLVNLKKCNFIACNLTDAPLNTLPQNIRELSLKASVITDKQLTALKKLPSLFSLNISNTHIEGNTLDELSASLERLNLSGCKYLKGNWNEKLQKLPQLKEKNLIGCPGSKPPEPYFFKFKKNNSSRNPADTSHNNNAIPTSSAISSSTGTANTSCCSVM